MKKIILVLTILSNLCFASEAVLKLDSHIGTGCPMGTITAISTDDGKAISILFDEFYTEIPQYDQNNDNDDVLDSANGANILKSQKTVSNKNCILKFTSILKEGYKVDSLEISIDSRGATTMDPGIQGRFMTQLQSYSGLASYRSRSGRDHLVGRKLWRSTELGTDEDWTISSNISVPVNSRCALRGDHEIDFHLKSHMILMNRTSNDELAGFMALDTTDINSGLKLKLRISTCRGTRPTTRATPTRTTRTTRTMRDTRTSRSSDRLNTRGRVIRR